MKVDGSYEKRAALVIEIYGSAGHIPDFDLVRRVWVPQMAVAHFSSDGSVESKRATTLPGYLLVEAILTYKLYAALRQPDLPHVFGWLRCESCWPSQVSLPEIRNLACIEFSEPPPLSPAPTFRVGDRVFLSGLGIEGEVQDVSDTYVVVEVAIFQGRVPFRVRRELLSEVSRLR